MKTILVVYSDKKSLSKDDKLRFKKYSFNTKEDVKEGDIIESESYNTKLHVVRVLESSFKFFNSNTGELSNEFNSASQWEIRELKLANKEEDVIYFDYVSKVEREKTEEA